MNTTTRKKTWNWVKQNMIMFAFVALFIIFGFLSPVFLHSDNLLNITRQISFRGIAAVGMMLVILTGGIDLSIGSTVQLVNVICPLLMVKQGVSPFVAILACFGVALLIGLFNGLLVAKVKIPPMIVTMASMNAINGAAFLISGGQPVFGFDDSFAFMGQGYLGIIPIPTIIMFGMFIIGAFVLKKTTFGRSLYAIGGNEEAARLSGVNVDRTKIWAYVLNSLFACAAGILMLSRLMSGTPNTGKGFEFEVITAVVLGGVSVSGGSGRVFSVIFGVLIIGVLNNGLTLIGLNTYWQLVFNGLVLVLAVSADYISKRRSSTVVDSDSKEETVKSEG